MNPSLLTNLTDRELLDQVDRSHPEIRELARRLEDALDELKDALEECELLEIDLEDLPHA